MSTECVCSSLRMAARRLTRIFDAALACEGVNTSQYALLNTLRSWPDAPPTVQQLADRLEMDRTTLAHNLRPLERDGFVAVSADGADRRVRRIELTDRGRAKRDACFPLWQAAQQRFDRDFGSERCRELIGSLRSIAHFYGSPPAEGRILEQADAG